MQFNCCLCQIQNADQDFMSILFAAIGEEVIAAERILKIISRFFQQHGLLRPIAHGRELKLVFCVAGGQQIA